MALDYSILNKKPIITRNGEQFYDLLVQTINPDIPITGSFLVVNKYYVARPDLISLAVYGEDTFADIICKINGISNPFELNENDILIIPHIEVILDIINKEPTKSVFIDSDKDQELMTGFMDTSLQKDVNDIRSPNEQIKGMKNLIVDEENGLLIY